MGADDNGGSDNHTMFSNQDETIYGQITKAEVTKYFVGITALNPIPHLNMLVTKYLGSASDDPTEDDVGKGHPTLAEILELCRHLQYWHWPSRIFSSMWEERGVIRFVRLFQVDHLASDLSKKN